MNLIPTIAFQPWPKIPRLKRDIIITEKIDGTNAGILVADGLSVVDDDGEPVPAGVYASSRTRWITPESDNYNFAKWVHENSETLREDLGPGMHFGEWWGAGIQRKYGLSEKRFSLFNTSKWQPIFHNRGFATPRLGVVPVLYEGPFVCGEIYYGNTTPWDIASFKLSVNGSVAAPGFMNPEGIVVFHVAANKAFKFTLDGDGHKESKESR